MGTDQEPSRCLHNFMSGDLTGLCLYIHKHVQLQYIENTTYNIWSMQKVANRKKEKKRRYRMKKFILRERERI